MNEEGEEPSGSEVPEVSDPRHHLVASGDTVDYEYEVGSFVSADPSCNTAIILVAEVDSRLLVALPEGAWHRKRSKRAIAPNSISKAVQVAILPARPSDREQPQGTASLKVWLGLLSSEFEGQLTFPAEEELDVVFPIGQNGEPQLPYAAALVAVARDHFTFFSAESGVPQPPGLDTPALAQRVSTMEGALEDIQKSLAQLLGAASTPPERKPALVARPKPASRHPQSHTMDPGVAAQALQAGVTPNALAEITAALDIPDTMMPAVEQKETRGDSSEEEEEAVAGGGDATGSADPMVQALVKLTTIVDRMDATKKKKGKSIDHILDRAESGSHPAISGSTRTKSAALRAFQALLLKDPRLIYQSLERHLQEDWELGGAQPGVMVNTITARGWLEHRSRIQAFPSAIRPAWIIAGIWDALRQNKPDEARARAGLGLAMLDQQGCDAGNWLIASELSLEAAPPYTSFQNHSPPSSWETPHTKLVDGRLFDLVVSKLKDLAEFHEKKSKLGGGGAKRVEEIPPNPKPTPKAKADPKKGAGKGRGKKGEDAREVEPPNAGQ